MAKGTWNTVDRWMRWLHLYPGLFLMPWLLVYGISALCLNHHQWFRETLGVTPAKWEEVEARPFVARDDFPTQPGQQAQVILDYMNLDGPHRVQGQPNPQQLTVMRISGAGNYRVRWFKQQGRIVVERQRPFSVYRLIHHLHFRSGYGQSYAEVILWAIVVDITAIAMCLWCVSGFYLWWRRTRPRRQGIVVTLSSLLLFTALVIQLCR